MSESVASTKDVQVDSVPMTPHKYPLWVITLLLLTIGCFLFSVPLIPRLYRAAISLHEGDRFLEKKEFDNAIKHYLAVIENFPGSEAAKINFAICVFSNSSVENDEMGLSALGGVDLDQFEWAEISKVMPKKYNEYFETQKR